jgi:hypothetical protein
VIAELPGNDWKLASNLNVRTGLDQATRLSFEPACRTLACDCDCNGPSASGAHVLEAGDRELLAFGEQVFVTGRESDDKSGQPVLVERRLDFIDELPTASHKKQHVPRLDSCYGVNHLRSRMGG